MENYSVGSLFIDLIFTFATFTIFPLIYRMLKKGNIDNAKENTIVVINSIVVFVLYSALMLLLTKGGQIANLGPAIFYGFINKLVFLEGSQKRSSVVLLISSIICFVCAFFAFGILFLSLSIAGIVCYIIYVCQPVEKICCGNCMAVIDASDSFCKSCGFEFYKESPKVIDDDLLCSNCGYLVSKSDAFCIHCGTRLRILCNKCNSLVKESDTFCQKCGNKLKVEQEEKIKTKTCKECGLIIDASASFCTNCGAKFVQKRRKRKKSIRKETSEN